MVVKQNREKGLHCVCTGRADANVTEISYLGQFFSLSLGLFSVSQRFFFFSVKVFNNSAINCEISCLFSYF